MAKLKYFNASSQSPEIIQTFQLEGPKEAACLENRELFYESEVYQSELEKQLAVAENNYRELYEFAPVGYFDLDEDNHIAKVNLTGTQLFGVPRSRLLGKRFSTFISKDSQPVFHRHLQEVFSARIKQSCELKFLRNDGAYFYGQLESITVTEPIQGITWLRLSIIDIGERRLTEQALQSSEEKFRAIIETTKEWIWTIDVKGRYFYSNPAVTNILGYSVAEILSRNRLLLIHKDDRLIVSKMMPTLIRSRQGWNNLILRWRCKDKSYRYLESNAVPFFDLQGKLLGFRGADRDITSRKLAEEQLRQRQIELAQVSRLNSLGELASTLAHELTQPLTAINAYISGCINRLSLDNSQSNNLLLDALQQAAQQAERAGQIIHRIKDFVKRGKLHFEKVKVNEVIHECVTLIKKEFPDSNVEIHVELEPPLVFITADKIQLEQVLLNLLRNSIEAMTDYAIIDPKVQIKCAKCFNQHILISVNDNGPGFCIEGDVDKLFEACFTTKSNGLGMGLAISRTVIEAHQGRLTAYKNPRNQGAYFQIILPIDQENDGKQ